MDFREAPNDRNVIGIPWRAQQDAKSWLIGKDSDAGRDWGQEEKGMTEDEMAGWHHWPNGCEFEWTPGDGDGQGGLACCDSWGHKELDTTERLNWTEVASIMSNSLPHYEPLPSRILGPWDSAGKNTAVSCHALLQGIFPTQGLNPYLLNLCCTGRQVLYY